MGGAGKTPTVIKIVTMLKDSGLNPHILSRGYGGYFREAARVDVNKHSYLQVGDEPLLLSQYAPTWVGKSRVQTAQAAIEAGATTLIMDDGLQNSRLFKDYSIIVIDNLQGLGNKKIFPAGPLREPLQQGLKRANAVLFIGEENCHSRFKEISSCKPYYTAQLSPSGSVIPQKVIAFAGIGYPEKFRHTLQTSGFSVLDFIEFADHHPYTIIEIQKLKKLANLYKATLITTEKDFFRIPNSYKDNILILPVALKFTKDQDTLLKDLQNYF